MRNTGGNKYETTAGEIQFDQFSTFFEKPKMTSRKVTPTAVNVKVKKILTTFSCPLACVGTNLAAICPMEVHLPSEKLVLPYFSSPRGVATSVPFPEVRNRKGTESGLLYIQYRHISIFPTPRNALSVRSSVQFFYVHLLYFSNSANRISPKLLAVFLTT